jgi:N-acetylmuramoyl-L-alanine amidase
MLQSGATTRVWASDWTLIKYEGRDYVTVDNIAEFYRFGPVSRVSNNLLLGKPGRSLRGTVGSPELFINNLKFNLSYPVANSSSGPIISRMDLTKIIEPVLRPSKIKGAEKIDTIILDAGHGGHDNGAGGAWGYEKNFTLDVVQRTRSVLQALGYKVVLTRSSDYFVPLEDRVRFANRFDNALFISVHFNCGGPAANGVETYTLAPRGVPSMMADGPKVSDYTACRGNIHDCENMALATATHAALVSRSQLYDRGIKRARFVVIRDIQIPGVLIEGGFVTNPEDSRKIASSQYRQNMAYAISAAVTNYRNAVGTQVAPPLVAGHSISIRDLQPATAGATEVAQPTQETKLNESASSAPSTN